MTKREAGEPESRHWHVDRSVDSVLRKSKGVQPLRSLIHAKIFLNWHSQCHWLACNVHFRGAAGVREGFWAVFLLGTTGSGGGC